MTENETRPIFMKHHRLSHRYTWRGRLFMRDLFKDLKYGARALASHPGFTAVAVASLALGIGLNTTIFSVVNAVLLRPAPVDRPHELVRVYASKPGEFEQYSVSSYLDYVDYRDGNDVFSGLVGHSLILASYSREGRSEILIGEVVTTNYFDVLGVDMLLGRDFSDEENRAPGENPVALISHGFWQRHFGGNPGVLGQSIRLDGLRYTVIGVVPPSFTGMTPGFTLEAWVPVTMADEVETMGMNDVDGVPATDSRIRERGRRWMFLTGRLKEGVTLEQAQSQMSILAAGLAQEYPDFNKDLDVALVPASDVRLHPLLDQMLTPIAALLMGVVGMVLLIACANVANMLLAKATTRQKEIAVRLAIGAGRGRLIRQLLVESLLLSGFGGVLGLILSIWTTGLIKAFHPPIPITFTLDLGIDIRVLFFTLAISILTGVVFGLAPAFRASRTDLVSSLKETMFHRKAGGRLGLGNVLVVGQVALSLVLLVGAGLLLRGLVAARHVDLGFNPERLGIFTLNLDMNRYEDERAELFYQQALERIRSLPGVESASVGQRFPLEFNYNLTEIWVEGHELTPDEDSPLDVDIAMVDDTYFRTMNIPLLEGREFLTSDTADSAPVIIVSEALARLFWPEESAIGKRIRTRSGTSYAIVGTARNYKVRTVGEQPRPHLHFARAQRFSPYGSIVFKTAAAPANQLETVRRELLAMDPDLLIMEATTMEERMAVALFTVRMGGRLLSGFSLLAVLLAAVGLYGLIAYWVNQRTREIGIRMALGAGQDRILSFVVKRGMVLAGIGILFGLAGGFILSRILASSLYGVHPLDPWTYGASCLFLLAVAFFANAVPAWRAARVDPVTALHYE
jgi:predicted permease